MQKNTSELLASLGRDERDGSEFDLIAQLTSSVQRGSKLAQAQLQRIKNFDHEVAKVIDAEIIELFETWEGKFKELFSDHSIDSEEFQEILDSEEFEDLLAEMEIDADWDNYFAYNTGVESSVYPETIKYIFDGIRKSKIGAGPFGAQGNNGDQYQIAHYAIHVALSPLIPRSFLWDISVGEIAQDMTFYLRDRDHLSNIPAYLLSTCISPASSINLLKAIFALEDSTGPSFSQYVKEWLQFPLLVNPVTDIWLLSKLDPPNIANSMLNSFTESLDMESDFDDDIGGVLAGGFFVWSFNFEGLQAVFKLCQERSFDEEAFATMVLAQRIIQEFKSERAISENHLHSTSEIVRAVIFSNPNLEKTTKEKIDRHEAIFENKNLLELIALLWTRDDLSVVI